MPKPPTPKPTPTKPEPKTPIESHYAIPPISSIPEPPVGYPLTVRNLRGVKPRRSELVNLDQVVQDLVSFTDYAKVFGTLAPPRDQVIASLDRARQWSGMRVALAKWDRFCAIQEDVVEGLAHPLKRLRPAFDLATKADRNLATAHVSLAQLLGAMKAIVRKGVSTKQANTKAVAEGREPLRGKKLRAARNAAANEAWVAQEKARQPAPQKKKAAR